MKPNVEEFFTRYAAAYNKALEGDLDTALIRSFFTKKFLAAGPDSVNTGRNGPLFSFILKRAYAFYRKIGTKRLEILKVNETEIDQSHSMAKVFYRTHYLTKAGEMKNLEFDVTYLLEHQGDESKIFAFIAGDEMKAYRDAGII
ncbi:MAG TPA: hypothetical protein VFV50_06545 [Bdellovibrionales bacterium]|nr:hypothetical protein [Bdellovibrionales bacterium]